MQLAKIHSFDIAANAAFGEGQRHPGFKSVDDTGRDLGMHVKIVIEAVGEGIHQGLQPLGAFLVLSLHVDRIDEQLHAQVAKQLRLTLCLCQATHRVNIVCLDAVKIVLSLGVQCTEYRIGIGLPIDVCNAPFVSADGDVARPLFPAG